MDKIIQKENERLVILDLRSTNISSGAKDKVEEEKGRGRRTRRVQCDNDKRSVPRKMECGRSTSR